MKFTSLISKFFLLCSSFSILSASSIDELKQILEDEYKKYYQSIFIKAMELKPQKPIVGDFKDYEFLSIEIISYKSRGYFKADFKHENAIKSLYFSYNMIADAYVLVAKNDMKKEQNVGMFDFKKQKMDINKIPQNAVFSIQSNLICKTNIKKDRIFTSSMFKTSFLINKNDNVVVEIKDGGLSVFVDMIALGSGNLGQKIKLKNKDGKIFYGIVKSHKNVLLLNL